MLRALGHESGSVVVDLGAGTGQFALAAAESFEPGGRRGRVPHLRAPGPAADVVYSRWALHDLPDFWKSIALQRIRAMLPVGGLLRLSDVVFSFGIDEAEDRVEAWCAALGADDSDWTREDADEHVRDEHSTYSWLLEPKIEAAGFEIRAAEYSDDRFLAEYLLTATPGARSPTAGTRGTPRRRRAGARRRVPGARSPGRTTRTW